MESNIERLILDTVHTDIMPTIENYIELNQKGFACCPFHSERTASFHIYRDNRYKCFGCGKGGDAISFIMEIEGCNYVEALKIAANIYNIEITDNDQNERTYTPKKALKRIASPDVPKKVLTFYEKDAVTASITLKDNLSKFFINKIGRCETERIWKEYCVGCAEDNRTIFWQIDIENNARNKHLVQYKTNGHRTNFVTYEHLGNDYEQCFFGEHLLNIYPNKSVAVVESEKTALMGAYKRPQLLWLACGGRNQLNSKKCKALKNRRVKLFPDIDSFEYWTKIEKPSDKEKEFKKIKELCEDIKVINWLEAYPQYKGTKADFADAWFDNMPDVPEEFTIDIPNPKTEQISYQTNEPQPYNDGVICFANLEEEYIYLNELFL